MVTPSAIAMLMTSSTAPQGRGERGEGGGIGMEGQGERRGGGREEGITKSGWQRQSTPEVGCRNAAHTTRHTSGDLQRVIVGFTIIVPKDLNHTVYKIPHSK